MFKVKINNHIRKESITLNICSMIKYVWAKKQTEYTMKLFNAQRHIRLKLLLRKQSATRSLII